MNDYLRDPKTAIIEGLSSALGDIAMSREYGGGEELNLTDEEEDRIVNEITTYILSRFNLTFKE